MKTNTNNNNRLNNLESIVNAIALKLGIGAENNDSSSVKQAAPKTSARIRENNNPPAMARKGIKGRVEDVIITLTQAMVDGRMKLPAKMFTKGNKCVVDGHTMTQQPHDQNRSTKFNPEIFGYEVEAGDVVTFSHEGGREWSVNIEAGEKPARKGNRPAKPAQVAKPANARKTQSAGSSKGKISRGESGTSSIKAKISEFAAMCIENASDDDFEQNENIKRTASFPVDARLYLTTAQNQKFRSWRKQNGLTLRKAVGLLNAEVYED